MTQGFIDALKSTKPVIFDKENVHLIDNGVIDSLDVVNIIAKLEETYNIKFDGKDITSENFASVNSIWALTELYKLRNMHNVTDVREHIS
jgi:acyl carrier protein